MDWPTWKQAATLAIISGLVATFVRRQTDGASFDSGGRSHRVAAAIVPAARELALVSTLYALWRIARTLPLDQPAGAIERARDLVRLQHVLHLPTE